MQEAIEERTPIVRARMKDRPPNKTIRNSHSRQRFITEKLKNEKTKMEDQQVVCTELQKRHNMKNVEEK